MLKFSGRVLSENDRNFAKAMDDLVKTQPWKLLKERLLEDIQSVKQGKFSSFIDICLASFKETRRQTLREVIDLVESKALLAKRLDT